MRHCFCCAECRDTAGARHTQDCDQRQSGHRSSGMRLDADAAQRLQLSAPATASILMDTQLESNLQSPSLTSSHLRSLAASVGARAAKVMKSMETVSSEGRFHCSAFGSERVGCFLCSTKSMVKWSWHFHAASAKHKAILADARKAASKPACRTMSGCGSAGGSTEACKGAPVETADLGAESVNNEDHGGC